jgi:hypothetical protein
MQKLLGFVAMMLLLVVGVLTASPAHAASEIYSGHSIDGMSEFTGDEVFGVLTDVGPVRVGAGRFTATHYAHVIYEIDKGPLFAGVGIGAADKHRALDNYLQFTLTAGMKYKMAEDHDLVFRWMHMSNAANLFQHGDESAKQRNRGIDFFTVGVSF